MPLAGVDAAGLPDAEGAPAAAGLDAEAPVAPLGEVALGAGAPVLLAAGAEPADVAPHPVKMAAPAKGISHAPSLLIAAFTCSLPCTDYSPARSMIRKP